MDSCLNCPSHTLQVWRAKCDRCLITDWLRVQTLGNFWFHSEKLLWNSAKRCVRRLQMELQWPSIKGVVASQVVWQQGCCCLPRRGLIDISNVWRMFYDLQLYSTFEGKMSKCVSFWSVSICSESCREWEIWKAYIRFFIKWMCEVSRKDFGNVPSGVAGFFVYVFVIGGQHTSKIILFISFFFFCDSVKYIKSMIVCPF